MYQKQIIRASFYGMLLVWAVGIIFIGLAALPYHSTSLPAHIQFKTQILFPEGWHFFTRDAREMQTRLYYKNAEGNWVADPHMPNVSAHNSFGANRSGRAMGVEYAMFINELAPDSWVAHEGPINELLHKSTEVPITEVSSTFRDPILCGEYLLLAQEPVPWAWSPSYDQVNMPVKATRLLVNCSL